MGVAVITSMWGGRAFLFQRAEAVLLVDDGKTKVGEANGGLNERMRSNEYLHRAVGHSLQHFAPRASFDDAREQLYAHRQVAKLFAQRGKVLLGQYFRRSHKAGLIAIVNG